MNRTNTVLIRVIDGEVADTAPPTALIPTYEGTPLLPPPPLPRRLDPRRPSWRVRAREEVVVLGIIAASVAPLAIAISQLLGGAR